MVLLLVALFLVGCKEGDVVNKADSKQDEGLMVKQSIELSEMIFSGKSMDVVGDYFESIRSNVGSLAYDNDFNIDILAVSNKYNFEYDIDKNTYEDVFVEHMEGENITNVVVVSKIEYSYGDYDENSVDELMEKYVTLVVTFSKDSGKIEKMDVYR